MKALLPIHTIEELEQYKECYRKHKARGFQTICYVYYKGSLSTAVYYVGFTMQNIYTYLKNHHKMKKIKDRFEEGFSIQLYKTFSEYSLIKLFRPTLNIIRGWRKYGRMMGGGNLRFVGEVFQKIRDKKVETNDPSFVCLNIDFVFIYIENAKTNPLYQKENTFLFTFMQHAIIQEISKKKPDFLLPFLYILEYCKIACLFQAFVSVHEIYLEHALQARSPSNMDTVPIYKDIIDLFIRRSFLNNSIMQYKERCSYTTSQMTYYYRKALLLSLSSTISS
jgi:hypothetical protein